MTDKVKGKNKDLRNQVFPYSKEYKEAGKMKQFCWSEESLSNCKYDHSNSSKKRTAYIMKIKYGR